MTAERRETGVDLVVTWPVVTCPVVTRPVVTCPVVFHGATIRAYSAETFGTNDVGAIRSRAF